MATSPLGGLTNGVDGRSFYGNVLFSTGPNAELGGTNDTGCHLDLPLRNCDLYLDNQQVVKEGQLVPARCAPRDAEELRVLAGARDVATAWIVLETACLRGTDRASVLPAA